MKASRTMRHVVLAVVVGMAASGAAGCRTMTPAVGTTVLENWLFPDHVSVLLARDHGEWASVSDQTWARGEFLGYIQAVLDATRIRIDLLARTVQVWVDADDAVWSPEHSPTGALLPIAQGRQSRGGMPILEATFEDLAAAIGLACDPDQTRDADGDRIEDNDCLLAACGGPCPIVDHCHPFATFDEMLEGAEGLVTALAVDLAHATVSWEHQPADPAGGWEARPVLHIRFHTNVEFGAAIIFPGFLEAALEYRFTYFDGSVLVPLGVGDGPCDSPPFGCDGDPDDGQEMTWTDFTSDIPEAHWETRNLVLEAPTAGWQYPRDGTDTDLSIELTSAAREFILTAWDSHRLFEYEGMVDRARAEILDGLRVATANIALLVQGYLSFLQPPGGLRLSTSLVRSCVNGLPDPPDIAPGRAPWLLMRFLEGSAGASRYFWNAMTGPLEAMDAYTGVSSFQFMGVHPANPYSVWTAGFDLMSDTDCDGIADDADLCPVTCSRASDLDDDHDSIGNSCDMCMLLPRSDTGLPRRSGDYYTGFVGRFTDADLDGVANWCDYCPEMNAYTLGEAGWIDPKREESATVDLNAWAAGPPAGYVGVAGKDDDGDGWANRCDNCPSVANRDQWNCNADWEKLNSWLADPPLPGIMGWGDACDPFYPCVDACLAPDSSPMLHADSLYGTTGWASPPDDGTAYVDICPDMLATPTPIDTHVRGCKCDQDDVDDDDCQTLLCPHNGGMGDPRRGWFDTDYDGVPRDDAETILPTPYEYKALYSDDASLGLIGTRSGSGRYAGYAAYYAGLDRTTRQEWNWLDDVCHGEYGVACGRPWLKMWFRPESTPGSSFSTVGGYSVPAYGNTYTQLVQADGQGVRSTLPPGVFESPYGGGGGSATGLTTPFNMDETGRLTINSGPLIDVLRVPCLAEWGPCPRWNVALLFDEPGSIVAGMTISNWSLKTNDLGWTLGAKVKPGYQFDLLDSSSAAEFDANGDPYRIWFFGGRKFDDGVSDQMWGANLVVLDDAGVPRSVDASGLPVAIKNAVAPDVTKVRYELSPITRENMWPAARAGAILACTGQVAASGGPCKDNCPKIEVALGLAEPPDGITNAAGSLVLVGGHGVAGPLDDIWVYEEKATWEKPPSAAASDPGPWPSGWRQLGTLPDVAGGLADAGTVQIGKTLWLVGGRTSAGVTADAFRIDLETGQAQRLAAVGAPGGRTTPAVAFDFAKSSLLVFGGTDGAGRALNDLWRIDVATGRWSHVLPACTGNSCPMGGGRPSMIVAAPSGEITVIPDRGLATPTTGGWTLKEGGWVSVGDKRGDLAVADCDANGAIEPLYAARCGQAGHGGYPDFGRMRCNDGELACQAPLKPSSVVNQYSTPNLAAMVADGDKLYGLHGAQVETYQVGSDGGLTLVRTNTLARAGTDLAVANGALVVADAQGATFYRIADGTRLSSVPTCGKARRVFAEGNRAYVVSVLSVLVVDVSDVSAPEVLQRTRLLVGPGELAVHSSSDCSWFDAGADRLLDRMSGGAGFGRSAAVYDHGRLYLHVLGGLHVLDLRNPYAPTLLGSVPVDFVRDMRVEDGFVYGNRPGHRTWVVAEQGGSWAYVGEHDVRVWVEGTVDAGDWTIHWEAGRLEVATRQ